MNPTVDFYFNKAQKWQDEMEQLRNFVLESGLTEELKWGVPCYTFQQSNVVLIHAFKEYCALLFTKGALLHDTNGLLIQQTKNTQAARQIRFTGIQEIIELKPAIEAYIFAAVEVEKAGLKVDFKEKTELTFPEELQKILDHDSNFKAAFESLTPGRQRAYTLYFSAPKQAKTRELRIEKYLQQILDGKGLNE